MTVEGRLSETPCVSTCERSTKAALSLTPSDILEKKEMNLNCATKAAADERSGRRGGTTPDKSQRLPRGWKCVASPRREK